MERVCLPIDIELKCNDMDSNGKVNFTIACNNVQCQQTFTIKKWTTSVMTNDSVKYNYTENCSTQPSVVSTSIPDTTMTTNSEREATPKATMCVTAMIGLGTVVSLLVVLVLVMTVGWVWTCWITKRRRGIIINSEQVR